MIDIKGEEKSLECMISVKWDENRNPARKELPRGWAFFAFKSGAKALYCGYTPNLAQRLATLRRKAESQAPYEKLVRSADALEFVACPEALDALIMHKVYAHSHHPLYQNVLRPEADYVYLALDAFRFPFISIQNHTNDDWTYVGPWRSRFFLADVSDCLSRLLKIPFCESGDYPCEKLNIGSCHGYCQAFDEDFTEDEKPDLAKLDALLKEAYLHPNNGILEMIRQERAGYFDALEFAKADLLDSEIENLEQYRDWLNFLYVTKSLSFSTESITVENGLLSRCSFEDAEYHFPRAATEYRENERLALNLQDVDEARVIYDHYIKSQQG